MSKNKYIWSVLIGSSAISLTTAQMAVAQDSSTTPAFSEGDIVVTATRTAESASRVPLSISAFSQASLDKTGVRSISDVTRQTPGLVIENTRNSTNIAIRGISSIAGAATTGIYIDDTPIQIRTLGYGGGNAYPAVFDLERVEVLRGPQGTLFGAGSEGGTVRFITPKPGLAHYSGYARGEIAFTEHGAPSAEIGAAIGGPIVTDKVGFRVSAFVRRDGGYVDRKKFDTLDLVDENSNWQRTYVARGALAFAPTDNLTITPSVYYQKQYTNDSSYYWESLSDTEHGRFVNGNPAQEFVRDKFILPSITAEYSFDFADFIALGSYYDRKQHINLDYTTFDQSLFTGLSLPSLPGQIAQSTFRNSQKNYTAEIRLQSSDPDARLRWVIGGFWSSAKQIAIQQVEDLFFPIYIESQFGVPYTDVFGQALVDGRFIYDQLSRTHDKQYAVFGEANFRVVDGLTLTAGLRYGKTKFTINADAAGPVVGPQAIDTGGQSETPLTPKFGANYQIDSDNMIYATAAKGFRPGGYNPAVGVPCGPQLASLGLTDRQPTYDSDSVWSYEVGTKNKLFNRAIQMEASAYQINWDNIQNVVNLNTCGFRFVSNQGSVRSRGFDLQLQFNLIENLSLSTAIGYTSAKFRETVFAGPAATLAVVTKGDAVVAPPWTVAIHGEYEHDLGGKTGYFRVDYNYRSHQNAITPTLNPANGGTDLTIDNLPASHLVSLRSGLRFAGIDASLFVNNLFNENAWSARQRDNGRSTLYRAQTFRPRTIGLTASYRY